LDMSNQVAANEIRIDLLDKQNQSMRKTLDKLSRRNTVPSLPVNEVKYPSVQPLSTTQLWSQPDSQKVIENHRNSIVGPQRPRSSKSSAESHLSQGKIA